MASAGQLVPVDKDDSDDSGLDAAQVAALDMLISLGGKPRENADEPYDKNPRIRAYQLIFEGRFAGPGRGQGRKPRKPRAAEVIAEEIRSQPMVRRMKKALKMAMEDKSPRTRLDAVKLAMDIENRESALQLKESAADQIGDTREELLGTLIELVTQPATAAALEAQAEVIQVSDDDIEDVEVIEDDEEQQEDPDDTEGFFDPEDSTSDTGAPRAERTTPSATGSRSDSGSIGDNGSGRSSRRSEKSPNPIVAAAVRRSQERRRAS